MARNNFAPALADLYAEVWDVVLKASWDEAKHPRDASGRFGSGSGGAKPKEPKPSAKPKQPAGQPFDARAQQHAERNQERLAQALPGAAAIPGNAPSDVEQELCSPKPCHRHQFELKTLLTSKRGNVRMTSAAQARKLQRLGEEPPPLRRQWTIAIDHRAAYAGGNLDKASVFPCRVREGTGSFNVGGMHEVHSPEELQALLNTPTEKLPDTAKPPGTGFYAEWMNGSARKRQQMAKAAFGREAARLARRQKGTNELLR